MSPVAWGYPMKTIYQEHETSVCRRPQLTRSIVAILTIFTATGCQSIQPMPTSVVINWSSSFEISCSFDADADPYPVLHCQSFEKGEWQVSIEDGRECPALILQQKGREKEERFILPVLAKVAPESLTPCSSADNTNGILRFTFTGRDCRNKDGVATLIVCNSSEE